MRNCLDNLFELKVWKQYLSAKHYKGRERSSTSILESRNWNLDQGMVISLDT